MIDKKSKNTYEKTLVTPLEKEMWKSLKKISFEKEISMNQLIRNAIQKIINSYRKNVDNEL